MKVHLLRLNGFRTFCGLMDRGSDGYETQTLEQERETLAVSCKSCFRIATKKGFLR